MSLRHLLQVTLLIFLTTGASASTGVFYECDLDTKIADGWVSHKLGLVFDDQGQVTVIDSVILQVLGEPIKGRARRRGDTLRVTWNISGAKDSKGNIVPKFSYTARLDTQTLEVSVLAKPVGVPQRWSAKGTCKTRSPE